LVFKTVSVPWHIIHEIFVLFLGSYQNNSYLCHRITDAQAREVLEIAKEYQEKLLHQWKQFKEGKRIRIITIKKKR
jgi:hypothetical protein